jgi:type II restriction enzyme
MARKDGLRVTRAGTVINLTSAQQEGVLGAALATVIERLEAEFKVSLNHAREWRVADVVARLRAVFPEVAFHYFFERSSMRPDGGILSLVDSEGVLRPILIAEVKNQGTNDLRAAEGKPPQAKGNAIERLGKNVIGFRTAMLTESITPFVCFGYGVDFAETSSILDRVVTVAMFGPLNTVSVINEGGEGGLFNRGSFFFREEAWSAADMASIMYEIASRSIHYYFAKYGESAFKS